MERMNASGADGLPQSASLLTSSPPSFTSSWNDVQLAQATRERFGSQSNLQDVWVEDSCHVLAIY